jgi:hypothetical protein
MEDVLDLYAEPYDPRRPQVCLDESPYHLVSEKRQPVPAAPGQAARYDYEDKRAFGGRFLNEKDETGPSTTMEVLNPL